MDPSAIPSLGATPMETPPVIPTQEPAISQEPDFLGDPGFLKGIPEQDRHIVQKYLSTIDAGINNKFNSIHEQYKPFKELGVDVPTIQEALQINNILRNDPVAFFNNLQETLKQLEAEGLLDMGLENDGLGTPTPPVNDGGSDSIYEGLPPEVAKELSDLKTMVKTLSDGFESNKKSAEEAQQMQQLDNMMKELHTKHGEFDDEYLLILLNYPAKIELVTLLDC